MATLTVYLHGFLDDVEFDARTELTDQTLTDGDAGNSQFTLDEFLTASLSSAGNFKGTFVEDGVTYIALARGPSSYTIYSTQDPAVKTLPANFTTPALETSAFTVCFLAGTLIATPMGEVAVEDLGIGDRIRTTAGKTVPVKWIGRQTVSTRFGPAERLMPVRFAAGSLGDSIPFNDLTVTADHAMLVGGVLCNAGALVNGATITRVPLAEMGDTYTVYHIETEAHEIILANGAHAETFIDNVSRRVFDNYAEFEALYGDVPEMKELPYPRAVSARQVPARIKSHLSVAKSA